MAKLDFKRRAIRIWEIGQGAVSDLSCWNGEQYFQDQCHQEEDPWDQVSIFERIERWKCARWWIWHANQAFWEDQVHVCLSIFQKGNGARHQAARIKPWWKRKTCRGAWFVDPAPGPSQTGICAYEQSWSRKVLVHHQTQPDKRGAEASFSNGIQIYLETGKSRQWRWKNRT